MWKIGNVEIQNRIVTAPLAGISNPVYRQLMHDFGAGLVVSEMISDKALHYENARTFDMCRTSPGEHPVSLQLFGNDPVTMAEAAEYLTSHTDCDIIDINMGCPVQKVIRAKAGSYFMAHPEEAYDVVRAVVTHTDRPVTVKMRTGWDQQHITCVELAQIVEKAGASAVAVHGRTRSQMYSGKSDLTWIKAVKEAVQISVIGNGDIHTVEDAKHMLTYTGCDAIMVGRALIGKPFLIPELVAGLKGESYTEPSYEERLDLCYSYAGKLCEYEGEHTAMCEMRGITSYYLCGLPYASSYKAQLAQVSTLEEMHVILEEYKSKIQQFQQEQAQWQKENA